MATKSVTRTVKVYSPQLGEREVKSSAETWKDLQSDLSKAGVTVSGMKSVIGETQHTLESNEAVIPMEDFTLFLMQKKTKSGAKKNPDNMSYRELRAEIQTILSKDESAKDLFNKNRNYTTKKTDELRALLKKYRVKGSPKASAGKAASSNKKGKGKGKSSPKASEKKTFKIKDKQVKNLGKLIKSLENIDVTHIDEDVHDDMSAPIASLKTSYDTLVVALEEQEQASESNAQLKSNYASIAANFGDVKK